MDHLLSILKTIFDQEHPGVLDGSLIVYFQQIFPIAIRLPRTYVRRSADNRSLSRSRNLLRRKVRCGGSKLPSPSVGGLRGVLVSDRMRFRAARQTCQPCADWCMARWRSGNAAVCKTAMRGFNSLTRLKFSLDIGRALSSLVERFPDKKEVHGPIP